MTPGGPVKGGFAGLFAKKEFFARSFPCNGLVVDLAIGETRQGPQKHEPLKQKASKTLRHGNGQRPSPVSHG
jgi:hypothetical protein